MRHDDGYGGLIASTGSEGLSLTEWASLGGLFFAAAASAIALWTALQNRALIRAALLPRLTTSLAESASTHPQLHISNAGGGLALNIRFVWARGGYCVDGEGGVRTFLKPGDTIEIAAAVPRSEPWWGVVSCEDVDGNLYAWSYDGHSAFARRRRWRKTPALEIKKLYRSWYPDWPLDRHLGAESRVLTRMSGMYPSSAFPTVAVPEARELEPTE